MKIRLIEPITFRSEPLPAGRESKYPTWTPTSS